jgi:type I restriction enzyme R subunit
MSTPSFQEDHVSQVPALQLLHNLGFFYLRPQEVFLERKGRFSNVLLEGILAEQLRRINRINYRGHELNFAETNIQQAIQALKDIPFDGLIRTSEQIYDLLSLGKSLEQTVDGDKKSFTLQFIDWRNPGNNVFHVTSEFEVERSGSKEVCRPDIVLFVNGIPLGVIECKTPVSGPRNDALEQALSQQIRNQADEYIPRLFTYAQLLLGVSKTEALYGTAGTGLKFWSRWREIEDGKERENLQELQNLVNRPLTKAQKDRLFADRFGYMRGYFDESEADERQVTEQDKALFCLFRPERLIELAFRFIVYDAGEKKIARYQQYFTVRSILARVREMGPNGKRAGGVVWHTQGSGKSLTMVMLAKNLALEPAMPGQMIVLVTDRVDLDEQIKKTFHQCGLDPKQAQTGKHLGQLISDGKESVVTTVIDKFDAALKVGEFKNESANLFVLVDESHRSVYGETGARMEKVLPNACFVGFTGTPLMRKEKNTAQKFGGIIPPAYTIRQAVCDNAVLRLLYEGRHAKQDVKENAIDKWFEVATERLNDRQRADLKRKFSNAEQLDKAQSRIFLIAYDISQHFEQNWQGTPFKAQLTAPDKATAIQFKEYFDQFGKVKAEVLISGPDTREGNEDIYTVGKEAVQAFWARMMAKYGNEKDYNKQLINAFKHGPEPEIIIVVDKLLTGFDAPRNTVLYICKPLKEHNLLQAIARVNRLHEGKDFGYILDYHGVVHELNNALDLYSTLPEFDKEDLADTLLDVMEEVSKLPQRHSELWDVFKGVKNRLDVEEYEKLLAQDDLREIFYGKLSAYTRTLAVALATARFLQETPEEKQSKYKNDLVFFQKLRLAVKRRYADGIDYKDYEAKVQKLIDAHVTSDEMLQITELVDIFDKEKFAAEVGKLDQNDAAKADTIAHRTQKTITEKMDDDPVFYRKFSKILQEAIEAYRAKRISDAEYLKRAIEVMSSVLSRSGDRLPPRLENREVAKAFYGVVSEVLNRLQGDGSDPHLAADLAVRIDDVIQRNVVVDWILNADVQNQMRNEIDDLLYGLKADGKIGLSTDDMDSIVERSIEIAKHRYNR